MSIYRGTVRHVGVGVYVDKLSWETVYHIDASTSEIAMIALVFAANAELPLLLDNIFIDRLQTHIPEIDGTTTTEVVSLEGERDSTGFVLPAWNSLNVQWTVLGASRPCRKFLRVGLKESDVAGQELESDMYDLAVTYAQAIAEDGRFTNPGGIALEATGYAVNRIVGMRQPKWSRRAKPGFHRGYVPNA